MHSLKKLKKIKKNSSELDLFLTTGMEVFSTLHEKKKEISHKTNIKIYNLTKNLNI